MIIRYSLIEQSLLRYFILFSAILGACTLNMAWFVQPYLIEIDITTERYWGFIAAALNLAVASTAFYSHIIEKKIPQRIVLMTLLFSLSICYVISANLLNYWGLLIIFVFYFVRGFATPILREYMNRDTPSEMRATVMSIRSFIIRILYFIIGPFLGYFADVYTFTQALTLAGIIFFILGGICLIFLFSNLRKAN